MATPAYEITETGEVTYPEPRFRDWEVRRQAYSHVLGDLVCGYVRSLTSDTTSPKILDVAAGEGYTAELLEDAGFAHSIISTDIDALALHNDRWLPRDETLPRIVSNLRQLPVKTESIDLVTSISGCNTIIVEDLSVISQIVRVLRKAGSMLLTHDTPRGVAIILEALFDQRLSVPQEAVSVSFDGLDNILQPAYTEPHAKNTVITFDDKGEISAPAMVDSRTMDAALLAVTTQIGIHPVTLSTYSELTKNPRSEALYAPIFAEAAARLVRQGSAARIFEGHGDNESWNCFFYTMLAHDLEQIFDEVKIEEQKRKVMIEPQAVVAQDGTVFFPKRVQRDTIGNLYYFDLTKEATQAELDFRAKFIFAKKSS